MTIIETITAEMERRGWSAARLGHEAGVHPRQVQRLVKGDSIAYDRLEKILDVLDLELKPRRQRRRRDS